MAEITIETDQFRDSDENQAGPQTNVADVEVAQAQADAAVEIARAQADAAVEIAAAQIEVNREVSDEWLTTQFEGVRDALERLQSQMTDLQAGMASIAEAILALSIPTTPAPAPTPEPTPEPTPPTGADEPPASRQKQNRRLF